MSLHQFIRFDSNTFDEVLQALLRNKLRSMLTAFGIFWGIFMLVFLMGGGRGFQGLMAANFEGVATNAYFAIAQPTTKPYNGFKEGREWSLDLSDVDRVKRSIPQIAIATPIVAEWAVNLKHKDRSTMAVTMKGVMTDYAHVEMPEIIAGRNLHAADIDEYRRVCVLGSDLAKNLFGDATTAIGKHIQVGDYHYEVVGINGRQGNMGLMGPAPRTVTVPFSTMQRLGNYGNNIHVLALTLQKGYTVERIQPQIRHVLKQAHNIAPHDTKALMDFNLEMLFNMINNLFEGIQLLVWMIGIGTLVAGAIGVSNIMMVTVSERTVEIGIRRAIGARPSHILTQIISESMLLTIVAGLCGIVFATLLLAIVEQIAESSLHLDANFQVSFSMAIGAAFVLAVLGATAGIMPAIRALKVRPIDAIRDE